MKKGFRKTFSDFREIVAGLACLALLLGFIASISYIAVALVVLFCVFGVIYVIKEAGKDPSEDESTEDKAER